MQRARTKNTDKDLKGIKKKEKKKPNSGDGNIPRTVHASLLSSRQVNRTYLWPPISRMKEAPWESILSPGGILNNTLFPRNQYCLWKIRPSAWISKSASSNGICCFTSCWYIVRTCTRNGMGWNWLPYVKMPVGWGQGIASNGIVTPSITSGSTRRSRAALTGAPSEQ